MSTKLHRAGIAAAASVLLLMSSACGGDDASNGDEQSQSSEQGGSDDGQEGNASEDDGSADSAAGDEMAGNMVGPGCADYAKQVPSGTGSVEGMAKDPVAVAAGNNPMLKTLTQAVSGKLNSKVNLVDTLNGDEFTVFAPVDDAFAKVPKDTLESLKTDDKTLESILTYHVVPGQVAPNDIAGEHETVQGAPVKVSGSGDNLKVGDNASVICGGVKTKNATVYMIDSVLMPPKS